MMWAEFDRISPLRWAARLISGLPQIVSAVFRAQGVKVPLNEANSQWEVVPANNIKNPFTAFENALFAATQ